MKKNNLNFNVELHYSENELAEENIQHLFQFILSLGDDNSQKTNGEEKRTSLQQVRDGNKGQ